MTASQRTDWIASSGAPLQGELEIPGDKSISHRAVMLAALAAVASAWTGEVKGILRPLTGKIAEPTRTPTSVPAMKAQSSSAPLQQWASAMASVAGKTTALRCVRAGQLQSSPWAIMADPLVTKLANSGEVRSRVPRMRARGAAPCRCT